MCVCARAYVCVFVRTRVRACSYCVCACVRACVRVRPLTSVLYYLREERISTESKTSPNAHARNVDDLKRNEGRHDYCL